MPLKATEVHLYSHKKTRRQKVRTNIILPQAQPRVTVSIPKAIGAKVPVSMGVGLRQAGTGAWIGYLQA